jgi:low affinity Fe/Cu permease
MENTKEKTRLGIFEKFSAKVTALAGSTPAFLIALGLIVVWAITGPIFNYSEQWQLVINTGTTIITFLMVFLIQKTQNKESLSIQLKLNELVAANEFASNRLVNVENMTEDELKVILFYRPAVCAFFGRLQWYHGKPIMFSAHGVNAGNDLIVQANGLPRPLQSMRILRQVDIDQTEVRIIDHGSQCFLHIRRQRSKSGSVLPAGVLTAMPFIPSNTACLAAARVPECHIELPRFSPILMPLSTTSVLAHRCVPRATQSAGVPFTR